MKWISNAYYNWRKGKDKELQKKLENGREAQTRVEINNQIQARPPAVQSLMARISSNILEMASTLWFRKKMLIFLALEIFLAEIEIMKSKKGKRLKIN